MPAFPLEIFYDGLCSVCSAEIEHYRQRNPQQRLRFIDIRDAAFRPQDYGKSQAEFMARMHVRDQQGRFFAGVEAFLLIWQAYPSGSPYRLLGAVIGFPGINLLARGGYRVFARYRYLLPKNPATCASDSCNLHHPH
jgi:predicted DCC family thiol-disulfide oxidoreductase YuxK